MPDAIPYEDFDSRDNGRFAWWFKLSPKRKLGLLIASSLLIIIFALLIALSIDKTYDYGDITTENIIQPDCILSLNEDLQNPQPLLLSNLGDNGHEAFLVPTNKQEIRISYGSTIFIACPEGNLTIDESLTDTDIEDAICLGDKMFTIKQITTKISSITCTESKSKAMYTGELCAETYKEIKIGFDLSDDQFITLMYVCFDEIKQNSIYSMYNLTSKIEYQQEGGTTPKFIQGEFYNLGEKKLDNLYNNETQKETINELLGLESNSSKYINVNDDVFLNRGHLTARADFIYGSQQEATYYYVNVAPQWKKINGGNWEKLEGNVRKYSSDKKLNLEVYTGIYGNATLTHEDSNEEIGLFLYVDGEGEDEKKGIPVPELYWKVLYDPLSAKAVAFCVVNNPYEKSPKPICPDICETIDWLTWEPKDPNLGLGYCCDVNEFRKVVTYLPNFEVKDVLK